MTGFPVALNLLFYRKFKPNISIFRTPLDNSQAAGPRAFTMDTALHKTFEITERQKMTVCLESFNTLNHAVFSNPVAIFNNANFTQITTTSGSPRAYQVALKYVF